MLCGFHLNLWNTHFGENHPQCKKSHYLRTEWKPHEEKEIFSQLPAVSTIHLRFKANEEKKAHLELQPNSALGRLQSQLSSNHSNMKDTKQECLTQPGNPSESWQYVTV